MLFLFRLGENLEMLVATGPGDKAFTAGVLPIYRYQFHPWFEDGITL
jgi:hypothetical protein